MRVGVIGMGAMGRPGALHCLAAGHPVIVYKRTRASGGVAVTRRRSGTPQWLTSRRRESEKSIAIPIH